MATGSACRDQQLAVDLSWDRKYQPRTLADMALTEENRTRLQGYVEAEIFPHLLLYGPSGVGKTTAAQILIESTACAARRRDHRRARVRRRSSLGP
ncbi:MAG: hypothetical protein ACYSX0_21920 [Planctomycetota bacterium]|jgi:replication-associated recombination protein RarA